MGCTSASPSKEGLLVAVVHGFPVPLPEDILLGGSHIQIAHDEDLQVDLMGSSCCCWRSSRVAPLRSSVMIFACNLLHCVLRPEHWEAGYCIEATQTQNSAA